MFFIDDIQMETIQKLYESALRRLEVRGGWYDQNLICDPGPQNQS